MVNFFEIGESSDDIGTIFENDPEQLIAFLKEKHSRSFTFKLRSAMYQGQHQITVEKLESVNHNQ